MTRYAWPGCVPAAKAGCAEGVQGRVGLDALSGGGKQFAGVCCPGREHGVHAGREMVLLKCEPALADWFRQQYADAVPGFYFDKRNWASVYLDGAAPDDVLAGVCAMSYRLVLEKLTKRARCELLGRQRTE